MNKLILANHDYVPRPGAGHSTDEGHQFQESLARAGWTLAGFGFDADDCTHVPTLLARHKPDMVYVADCRDWREDSFGTYDKRVCFRDYQCLADRSDIFKVTVVKDAGSLIEYQRKFSETIKADALIHYYHLRSVLEYSPWMRPYAKVRTHHTIDAEFVKTLDLTQPRRRGIVSGACSPVYPMRQLAVTNAESLDIDVQIHPGYGNKGCHTNDYLRRIAGYRTHVATASKFGFSLRKIIESVAVGCVPITDLPAFDILPEIDEALVRVSPGITIDELRDVIARTEEAWRIDRAMHFARKAWAYYDYPAEGRRLSEQLTAMAEGRAA